MQSAIIVRARLPARLEALRRQFVAEAARSLPAHVTLLYPFVEPPLLDAHVRGALRTVAAGSAPFDYRLVGAGSWPETVYLAVEPVEPFVVLQAALAAAFPAYPVYGEPQGFRFVPHVTIAEGPETDGPRTLGDPAWALVPRPARAAALEVIADDGLGWRLVWRVRLGAQAVARMRP
jgi:2'-5' RNA ligase